MGRLLVHRVPSIGLYGLSEYTFRGQGTGGESVEEPSNLLVRAGPMHHVDTLGQELRRRTLTDPAVHRREPRTIVHYVIPELALIPRHVVAVTVRYAGELPRH